MATVPDSIVLVVDKKKIKILDAWIPRWQFLVDWKEEWSNTDIAWKSTSYSEIQIWVKLNQLMDKYSDFDSQEPTKHKSLILSSLFSTVQYMNPNGINYLRFCTIDDDVNTKDRRRLYEQVGRTIRTAGIRYPYTLRNNDDLQLHHNLYLYRDLAYGVSREYDDAIVLPFNDLDERLQQMILDADLNILTGIMHTAYWLTLSDQKRRLAGSSVDLPWNLINWDDIVLFGYDEIVLSTETYPEHSEYMYEVISHLLWIANNSNFTTAYVLGTIEGDFGGNIVVKGLTTEDLLEAIGDYYEKNPPLFKKSKMNVARRYTSSNTIYFDAYGVRETVTILHRDQISILSDDFPRLLDVYCRRLDYLAEGKNEERNVEVHNNCDVHEEVYTLFADLFEVIPHKRERKKDIVRLNVALNHVARCSWYVSDLFTIGTEDYKEVCSRLIDSLGSRFLTSITGLLVQHLSQRDNRSNSDRILHNRMEKFATTAMEVLDEAESTGFQEWPMEIYSYSSY